MMKIPIETLEENNISTMHLDDEIGTYNTFLIVTDEIIKEAFEIVLNDPEHIQEKLIEFKDIHQEILDYRTIAREEIVKLGGK